jgi:hypothetical protein
MARCSSSASRSVSPSVAKYVVKRCGPPSQGWCTFLRNHAPNIAAMDLFVVPTIGFDLLCVLAGVRLARDHLVVVGETHLRRVLKSYARYYNEMRTHRSLDKDAPLSRPVQRTGIIMSHALVGGLHHHYVRV